MLHSKYISMLFLCYFQNKLECSDLFKFCPGKPNICESKAGLTLSKVNVFIHRRRNKLECF